MGFCMPTDATAAEPDWFLRDYAPAAGVYDELRSSADELRPQWLDVREGFLQLGPEEFERRTRQAERMLYENGVTYNVFGGDQQAQRPWRLDLLPLVLPAAEWSHVESALSQRARLLNLIVEDLYGDQRSLAEGWLPPEAVFSHPGFQRAFHGLPGSGAAPLCLYGAELARSPNGQWWVMADRTEAPAGPGYALENRIVSARMLPQIMHKVEVERLAPFFLRVQNALRRRVRRAVDNPRVVLLSSGPRNSLYFEDVYLARYLGYILAEGNDLAVRDEQVFLKTLSGLMPVDVILSRGAEFGIDPLEVGGHASHGVSGLLQAIRAGSVAVANRPGCGLLEAPVFMAYLPGLCRHLLGEDLQTPSVATWWCGQAPALEYVLEHFDNLVIKPAFLASGSEEILPRDLPKAKREELRNQILARPCSYVAQETVARSASPVWENGKSSAGHLAIRCFLVDEGESYSIMPGGLIRVAPDTSPMQLSVTAGAGSKDLWIRSEGPVAPVSLLVPENQPVALRRTGALFPSRVADDLYWLGQSLDRAEYLTRLLRAVVDRLASEDDDAFPELPRMLRALVDQGQLEAGFVMSEFTAQLPALEENLPVSLFDDSEAHSLARAMSELQRLAARTRDWLSADTWLKFNQAASNFMDAGSRDRNDLGDVLDTLNRLLLDLASASGLIANGMIRGPAWRFLDMGRRIERGRNVAILLRSTMLGEAPPDKPIMKALLEVLDCRMTYRSRYLDNLQANAVLDLAITDETCPNSIGFQLGMLSEHVDTLPQISDSPLRSEEKRLVMSAIHLVRMLTPEDLASPSGSTLQASIERVERRLKQLSDVLNRRYLVHASSPRQILPEVQQQRRIL
jgi:uncharacterized circularly permuted ATP-grasp superfamily protein/uncharacterized alpha-E superfamily protein